MLVQTKQLLTYVLVIRTPDLPGRRVGAFIPQLEVSRADYLEKLSGAPSLFVYDNSADVIGLTFGIANVTASLYCPEGLGILPLLSGNSLILEALQPESLLSLHLLEP